MKVMFVSSTGGHLTELLHWSQRLHPEPVDAVWVTHERSNSAQIAQIHPGVAVRYVAAVEPKQAGVALRMLPTARRMLRDEAPDVVMSAGAAVAVPFAVAARLRGTPFHYLESAARLEGPSLTGKMITRIDGKHRWCQASPAWPGWRAAGSVFDSFVASPDASPRPLQRRRRVAGHAGQLRFQRRGRVGTAGAVDAGAAAGGPVADRQFRRRRAALPTRAGSSVWRRRAVTSPSRN